MFLGRAGEVKGDYGNQYYKGVPYQLDKLGYTQPIQGGPVPAIVVHDASFLGTTLGAGVRLGTRPLGVMRLRMPPVVVRRTSWTPSVDNLIHIGRVHG